MPIPTAQVRVHVFQDNSPLNGQFDADEPELAGFAVTLDDAGGRYGMAGGLMMQDAFGNPLGTTYKACPAGGECAVEVERRGNGFLTTDAQGYVTFQNLRPGKYTAKVLPPSNGNWQQTTTIEGQKGQDAWVKANEPTFFTEFGPAGPHVEIGFTHLIPTVTLAPGSSPGSIIGTITNLHQSRPPDFTMFSGAPFDYTRAWVALNTGVNGSVVYASPTDEDGKFEITGVPAGDYTLAVWDSALDVIFAEKAVSVAAGAATDMKDIPVFSWFTRLYHYVFEDNNKNGIWDAGDGPGIREAAINTRWRDGSIYQSSATDGSGFVPFEETFPFFAWQIAEVDYGRFRATGATVVVDNGGNSNVTSNPQMPPGRGWSDSPTGSTRPCCFRRPRPTPRSGHRTSSRRRTRAACTHRGRAGPSRGLPGLRRPDERLHVGQGAIRRARDAPDRPQRVAVRRLPRPGRHRLERQREVRR